MNTENDPFRHLPDLKDKIVDPTRSSFRDFDIAALDQKMQKLGIANWRRTDEDREATRQTALADRTDDDLWVFAYGSLIWDPAFQFVEVRRAVAEGYQRSFCLKSELGRGSPDKPGLMAALDIGGECQGLAFRIDRSCIDAETRVIWSREMIIHAYYPRFIKLATPQGSVEALAFVMDRTAKNYLPGLNIDETARLMATGVGVFGSSLDYLDNLADHFAVLGILDDALLKLQDRARQIASRSSLARRPESQDVP